MRPSRTASFVRDVCTASYARRMPWLGTRRVAFVPVDRGRYNEFPVPPDWKTDIERRVFYDHDNVTGVDVSLRNFILTMSQGRADLTGDVLETITFEHPGDVAPGKPCGAARTDPTVGRIRRRSAARRQCQSPSLR